VVLYCYTIILSPKLPSSSARRAPNGTTVVYSQCVEGRGHCSNASKATTVKCGLQKRGCTRKLAILPSESVQLQSSSHGRRPLAPATPANSQSLKRWMTVDDWVLLRAKNLNLPEHPNDKFKPRYIRPFKVARQIKQDTYKPWQVSRSLDLPLIVNPHLMYISCNIYFLFTGHLCATLAGSRASA
jgi:hypothetical protein